MEPAVLAGTVSTALFASSNLPMLVKAARTRNLASYSLANLTLSNLANGIHTFYVLSLPAGPILALHGFYVVTMLFMLVWYLRFAPSRPRMRGDQVAGVHHGPGLGWGDRAHRASRRGRGVRGREAPSWSARRRPAAPARRRNGSRWPVDEMAYGPVP